ncbi:RHS repeat domain-containing protein [Abyssogena phaseoliformis symbiont]|uniref:RHS repeat domain-containing protein n=1 Tax=Abyssogena phaseoliformis symbiont TaxID=596095 RepID=UPI001916427E|nr:RHS repeat domain-containing protein [Abyssogena phaseoliformis symbiont]
MENVTGHYGHTLEFSYNDNNQLTTLITPNSRVYIYAYDANNNFLSVAYPNSPIKTYHYENTNFPHHLTGITSSNGVRFATYAYSSNGLAITTQHATTTNPTAQEKITFNYNSETKTTLTDAKGIQEVITFIEQHNSKKPISKIN